MRQLRRIMRMHHEGASAREIARSVGMARSTVQDALKRASAAKLSWPLGDELTDEVLEARLFARIGGGVGSGLRQRPEPDWGNLVRELRRPAVTMVILWEEYRQSCSGGYGYSRFCELLRAFQKRLSPVMRQHHVAGDKLFVDYSGKRLGIADPLTGEIRLAEIFVAVLGASNYTFAEVTWSQTLPDWIGSHVRLFRHIGGVPRLLVPDNLKSGVNKASFYDPEINRSYGRMTAHYDIGVLPARPKKPKDKASVEAGVRFAQGYIIGRLRNQTFFSLDEASAAVTQAMKAMNTRTMRKLGVSRADLLESLDRPALRALPLTDYEYAEWRLVRAGIDYHVEIDSFYYSVPHALIREKVDARITTRTIELFHRGKRVAARTGIEILFDRSLVAGMRARIIPHDGNPDALLARLLEGTGLIVRHSSGAYVVMRRPPPQTPSQMPSPFGPLPEAPPPDIIVTGYRESLVNAINIKRAAKRTIEVINAEDISAFPDLNLAESLQRMSGVTITRDAGEGRQIVLRGLDPDLTRTHLDGMEVLGNTASGMDNRGGVSRTRSFDYSLFASELFSRVTIEKSYAAEEDEGGIAGTVLLQTPQPFDYSGFKVVVSAKGQTNTNVADRVTPRLAGLVSNRWGDFGALVSVAYGIEDSNEFGYRNYSWNQIHVDPANIGPGVSAADAARLTTTDGSRVFAPQADTYSTWYTHRERLGVTLALQYHPDGRWQADFNGFYSRLHNARHDYALAASGTNSLTGDITGTQILQSDVISGNDLVAARYTGVDLRSESNVEVDTTNFYQGVLHTTFKPSARIIFAALAGYSESDYSLPVFDKVFLESQNHEFSFDDRLLMPHNVYGFDTTDPDQWNLMRLDAQQNYIQSAFRNAKIDMTFFLDSKSSFHSGVEYKKFLNAGTERIDKQFYNDPTDTVIPNSLKTLVPIDTLQNYVVGDVGKIYSFVGQDRNLSDQYTVPGTDYRVIEATWAAYTQYDLSSNFGDHKIDGNVGLRYFHTAFSSSGSLNVGSTLQPITFRHSYSAFLPALNMRFGLSDRWVLRFAASRDISRPTLSDLAAATTLTTAPFGGSITEGNPNLKPFTSNAAEASVEYYQGHIGFVSLGIFYKRLQSFITTEIGIIPYSATGLPLSYLLPGQNGSILFDVSQPVNGSGASIFGLEFAFRRDLNFLPAPFNHFGIMTSATYIDGSSAESFEGQSVSLPLVNLSKYAVNATLYYDATSWGARVSMAYRSPYLVGISGDGNIGSGIDSTNNIDFATHFNLNGAAKLTFEGINITNQHIVQFTDIAAQRTLANTSSGRTFLAGVSCNF